MLTASCSDACVAQGPEGRLPLPGKERIYIPWAANQAKWLPMPCCMNQLNSPRSPGSDKYNIHHAVCADFEHSCCLAVLVCFRKFEFASIASYLAHNAIPPIQPSWLPGMSNFLPSWHTTQGDSKEFIRSLQPPMGESHLLNLVT